MHTFLKNIFDIFRLDNRVTNCDIFHHELPFRNHIHDLQEIKIYFPLGNKELKLIEYYFMIYLLFFSYILYVFTDTVFYILH